MTRQNTFGFDLSDTKKRQSLKPRFTAYWQVTEYGRAIGYERYPSGRTYWLARIRLRDASYRRRRLGPAEDNPEIGDGLSFEAALAAAHSWFATTSFRSLATDARPIGSKEDLIACPIGDVYTVGHALRELVEWRRLASARSHFLTVLSLVNYHIVPRLFSLPAAEMNTERLRLFVKDVLETPPKMGNQAVKPRRPIEQMTPDQLRKRRKTVNTLLGQLRLALVMAWENGRIDSDRPWRCMRRLSNVDRPRMLHLSRSECSRLLSRCEPDMQDLILAALYTGCRVTELLRLEASYVGRDGDGVYITPVKSYRPRVVLLPDEGLAFFQRLADGKRPGDLLLRRTDGRPWYANYRHVFRRAVQDADLPREFCFHGLRHTYASQLIQNGSPLIVVAEQLGHSNIDTVSRTYGHLAPDVRLAEVRRCFAPLLIGKSPDNL